MKKVLWSRCFRLRRKIGIPTFIIIFIMSSGFFSSSVSLAADLSLDELVAKIQSNQDQVKDMYAETTTKITSNIQFPTSKQTGPQTMIQKSKMWTKGEKSKIEMLSPSKQTTVNDGKQMAIINPETGQRVVQELGKGIENRDQGIGGQGAMDLAKAKEFFDLSVKKLDASIPGNLDAYVITGVPRKENKFMGKMEFYVDPTKWAPVKIIMYGANNKPMSVSTIEYKSFPLQYSEAPSAARSEGVWLPVKNVSNVNTPAGKMSVEMVFDKVEVNKGIKDSVFKIE